MPERQTIARARRDKRQGKAATTQAGEFVREEIEHVREGKHGVRSTRQAIAIGLSKARRAGIELPPPGETQASAQTRRHAERDYEAGHRPTKKKSARRARAVTKALQREGRSAVSRRALSKQARTAAKRRGPASRSAAAKKAVRTKGAAGRAAASRKAARSRTRNLQRG